MRNFFVVLALFPWLISASRGDQSAAFRACLSDRIASTCDPARDDMEAGRRLPLYLRMLGWDCASNADYRCQREVTEEFETTGVSIEQFHGKWPFLRFLGIQEPASVLFSILNGYVHYRGLELVKRYVTVQNPMRIYYIIYAYIGMNAWLWSTVFHIRDFPSTEKLDYFSAGTYVLFGFFYAPIRVFRLYDLNYYGTLVRVWAALCFTALGAHIGYLTFVTFDYGYNMIANVVIGSMHGLIWVSYSLLHHKGRPAWVWWPALLVLVLAGAMSLELLDFPPWAYTIDAHSLWHLSTIPITLVWYKFLLKDAHWEQTTMSKKVKRDT